METNEPMRGPVVPRWIVATLGVFLIVLVGFMIVDRANSLSDKISGKKPDNTIAVSAEGKVKAVPDLAMINLGVLTQGSNPATVQDENSKKINKIIDYIKAQGISKDDISTSQFNIYPQYDYQSGRSIITGYQLNQTITIKIRGVNESTDKLGTILKGAVDQGANEVSNVYLTFDDANELRQQARTQAIEKAKQKAQELADAAGIKLGKVVSISESGSYNPMPYYAEGYGGANMVADAKAAAPNIEPGQQDITETMTVVFEVK